MPATTSNTEAAFLKYIAMRVKQAEAAIKEPLRVTYDFGDYDHFKTARGFGVTFDRLYQCHMRFSRKAFDYDISRFDGVLRHEIGHVIDMLFPKVYVDAWCKLRGVTPAQTSELRADSIAQAIWQEPIRYDNDTVQNTKHGQLSRPKHLNQ